MKTAISLPDDLFEEIDARARALKLSRSAFIARAARAYLQREREESDVTEAYNRAIAAFGQPGDDPGVAAIHRASHEAILAATKNDKW